MYEFNFVCVFGGIGWVELCCDQLFVKVFVCDFGCFMQGNDVKVWICGYVEVFGWNGYVVWGGYWWMMLDQCKCQCVCKNGQGVKGKGWVQCYGFGVVVEILMKVK